MRAPSCKGKIRLAKGGSVHRSPTMAGASCWSALGTHLYSSGECVAERWQGLSLCGRASPSRGRLPLVGRALCIVG